MFSKGFLVSNPEIPQGGDFLKGGMSRIFFEKKSPEKNQKFLKGGNLKDFDPPSPKKKVGNLPRGEI